MGARHLANNMVYRKIKMVSLVWIMMQKSCKSYWSPEYLQNGAIIEKNLFSFSLCSDCISTLEKCVSHHYLIIQNSQIQLCIWRSSWKKRKLIKLRLSSFCCFNFAQNLQILDTLHVCHISRAHSTLNQITVKGMYEYDVILMIKLYISILYQYQNISRIYI